MEKADLKDITTERLIEALNEPENTDIQPHIIEQIIKNLYENWSYNYDRIDIIEATINKLKNH